MSTFTCEVVARFLTSENSTFLIWFPPALQNGHSHFSVHRMAAKMAIGGDL